MTWSVVAPNVGHARRGARALAGPWLDRSRRLKLALAIALMIDPEGALAQPPPEPAPPAPAPVDPPAPPPPAPPSAPPLFRLRLTLNDDTAGLYRLSLAGGVVYLSSSEPVESYLGRDFGALLAELIRLAAHYRKVLGDAFGAADVHLG